MPRSRVDKFFFCRALSRFSMAELDALATASFATAGYVLVEDAIAGSDLESLKRELEEVVATAAAEATADGGAWDSAASGADSSHNDCVQILLAARANVAAADDTYATPLELAVVRGHESVAQALVRPSVDAINRSFERGEPTILHWLATNGCVKGLQLCLDAGARPDGVDDEGRTACEWAREEGHADAVRLLERRAK